VKLERDRWQQEAHDLLWNLGGCDAIASGWSKPHDYSKELGRPALASVSRLAERAESSESQLVAVREQLKKTRRMLRRM
jgi:hypothetical protein